MPEKDPFLQSVLLSAFCGAFGGAVRWFENWKVGGAFRLSIFLIDMAISSVVGFAMFWLAVDFDQHLSVAACMAGFGGNVGSRIFDLARIFFKKRVGLTKEDLEKYGD